MIKKRKRRYRNPKRRKSKNSTRAFKKRAREATCRTEDFLERAYRTDFIPNGCRDRRR